MDIKQVAALHSYVNWIFTILKRETDCEKKENLLLAWSMSNWIDTRSVYCPNIQYYISSHVHLYYAC